MNTTLDEIKYTIDKTLLAINSYNLHEKYNEYQEVYEIFKDKEGNEHFANTAANFLHGAENLKSLWHDKYPNPTLLDEKSYKLLNDPLEKDLIDELTYTVHKAKCYLQTIEKATEFNNVVNNAQKETSLEAQQELIDLAKIYFHQTMEQGESCNKLYPLTTEIEPLIQPLIEEAKEKLFASLDVAKSIEASLLGDSSADSYVE